MRAAVPILALALLAVPGCGEKRETTTGGASTQQSSPAAVTVSETEFKLSPASLEAEGGKVSIEVKNDGSTEHALEVEGPNGEVETPTLAPGKSATLTADLKPGTYEMYCPIDGHKDKGMKGELVVGGGGSGGGTSTDDSGGADDNGGGGSGGGGGGGGGY
jgi:plastocyanin